MTVLDYYNWVAFRDVLAAPRPRHFFYLQGYAYIRQNFLPRGGGKVSVDIFLHAHDAVGDIGVRRG